MSVYYTYKKLPSSAIKADEFYPGAIGFGGTPEDSVDAYYANGGSRFVERITTIKAKTPHAVTDTVKQQAIQSHYPW